MARAGRQQARYACGYCDITFSRPSDSNRHLTEVHGPLKFCPVENCGYTARRKQRMERHKNNAHPDVFNLPLNVPKDFSPPISPRPAHLTTNSTMMQRDHSQSSKSLLYRRDIAKGILGSSGSHESHESQGNQPHLPTSNFVAHNTVPPLTAHIPAPVSPYNGAMPLNTNVRGNGFTNYNTAVPLAPPPLPPQQFIPSQVNGCYAQQRNIHPTTVPSILDMPTAAFPSGPSPRPLRDANNFQLSEPLWGAGLGGEAGLGVPDHAFSSIHAQNATTPQTMHSTWSSHGQRMRQEDGAGAGVGAAGGSGNERYLPSRM